MLHHPFLLEVLSAVIRINNSPTIDGLHLCDAAIHKQLRPRDVAAVVGSEKNDSPGDLIGRAEPAERNAGENRLQTLSARSRGRQHVTESGGVGEARAHRVPADAVLLHVRRPGPREATYGGLAGAGNATPPPTPCWRRWRRSG